MENESEPAKHSRTRRRSGGRGANARLRAGAGISQLPWQVPVNPDAPISPLDEAGIYAIHDGAMRILEEIGVEFLNDEALEIFRKAGCRVEGENVRMGRDFVMEMLSHAPSEFQITPRNPDRRLTMGGNHVVFGCVSSPPNYWDLETGKMPGNQIHFRRMLKLAQTFNCIHLTGGYPVEPIDIPVPVRHLETTYDKLTLTDKVMVAYALGDQMVKDVMEMARIAAGLSHEAFEEAPRLYTNINSTSPLKHDKLMLNGWLQFVRRGQAVIATPFTLAGAMAPVTMAGAVTLSLAEALSVIALAQYVRPGVACMLGTFTSNVDMRSGAPAFGTPEFMRATQMTGQMARFYGLPMRGSGSCAANVPDAQAAHETSQSLWSTVQSGANYIYHSAGWLEGGLIASPEKFVQDCEILQQIQRYFDPRIVATTEADIAVDAVAEVGPRGHFFGAAHTQERYEDAFYQPFLSDWRNYEAWLNDGGIWTARRAHKIYRHLMDTFEPPPIDPAIKEELRAFVDRRKKEGGVEMEY